MSPQAENMLKRLKGAVDASTGRVLPVPAPGNPGLHELATLKLVTSVEAPAIYPRDYRVWTLTEAAWA